MRSACCRFVVLTLTLLPALPGAASRMPAPKPDTPVIPPKTLRPLTKPSGYIFAGTVTAVHSNASRDAKTVATVEITFHVDRGLRGVQTNQSLTIREWMGAWENGQRYRVGEKIFLFLYPLSKLGLTSVVGGAQGRFPINRNGRVGVSPVLFPIRPTAGRRPMASERTTFPLADFERAIRLAARTSP